MNKVSLFPQGAYIYDVRKKQIKQPRLREFYSTHKLPTADKKKGGGSKIPKSWQTAYVYGPSMPNFASESESVAGRLPFTRLLH